MIRCLTAALTSTLFAAEVRVLDPDGHAKQDVVVLCDGHSKGATITDAAGTTAVGDTCRRVQCVHGDFLTGEATIADGHAVCHLGAGVFVSGEIDRKVCGECTVILIGEGSARDSESSVYPPRIGPPLRTRSVESGSVDLPKDGRPGTFHLRPVPPGFYTFKVNRHTDEWSCTTDVGDLTAGLRSVTAVWREPVSFNVKVVGQDGKPRPDVPVRLWVSAMDGERAPQGGRCSSSRSEDLTTDKNGEVRILADPADAAAVVQAGYPDDTGYFASTSLSGKKGGKILITLPASP